LHIYKILIQYILLLVSIVGKVPSPTRVLSQGIRVRRSQRRWMSAALVRRDRREKERGGAGGGEQGGGATVLAVTVARGEESRV
jgi:hypothetical protein